MIKKIAFVVVVGLNDEVIYHDPDVPNGQYMTCNIDTFMEAWTAFGIWMVEVI
ncbi:MAG: hypothetical protein ACE5J9_06175 [Methanosarcinales archaeon]